MKITGLTAHIFEPRPNPIQEISKYIGPLSPFWQNGVVIINTDEGIKGIVTDRADKIVSMTKLFEKVKDHIVGQDPLDREKIGDMLTKRFIWPANLLGILDNGLWDIAGKYFNKPVYKLLGPKRDKIFGYASTVHHAKDETFIETAIKCKEVGFRAIKLHPYDVVEDDIPLCYKIREAVGDEIELMIDTILYPGPYNRIDAFKLAKVLDELNFLWFEDPLIKTDLTGLSELRKRCKTVQIRMGDRVEDIKEYDAMVQQGCIDIIAGPPGFGITHLLKLAHFAEIHHMNMEPHNFSGGNACLHVLLAINNANYCEVAVPMGRLDNDLYPNVYLDPIRIDKDGYVIAPKNPGLGFDLDFDQIKKITKETIKI